MQTADEKQGLAARWKWALGLAVAFAISMAIALTPRGESSNLAAETGAGGPFTLTASDGKPFTLKDLGGKPFAIYFGFMRCPDVCPTTLSRLALLRGKLGADGNKFAIVFVSVDPGHDKPEAVGEYVKLFGTPIIGLAGSEAQLAPVKQAYGVYAAKVPQPDGDYTVDHSSAVLLMDGKGRLADIISHDDPDPAALTKLKTLVG
jgi:protein SCO1/2